MNDLSKPAPVFELPVLTEEVSTKLFGTVTVSELPSRAIAKLYAENEPDKDPEGFGHALLCATVTGEHGERFTRALLEALPNRALPDMKLIMQAAVRLNGMDQEEVKNG